MLNKKRLPQRRRRVICSKGNRRRQQNINPFFFWPRHFKKRIEKSSQNRYTYRMEHLTKQQIVLLTLLVSFVTSLATGIITVSLMDQGTFDITQVINHVERTTAYVPAPIQAAAAVVTEPTLADTTAKVAKNVVRLKTRIGNTDTVLGMGIILSPVGLIVTDKATLTVPGSSDLGKNVVAELPNGENVPLQVVQ